jgi:hypothetical protein
MRLCDYLVCSFSSVRRFSRPSKYRSSAARNAGSAGAARPKRVMQERNFMSSGGAEHLVRGPPGDGIDRRGADAQALPEDRDLTGILDRAH